jgi:hypothetical protein
MFLFRLNGHLFSVEDARGQGGLCLGLPKDLREVITFPAPEEAMTGMETFSLICFTS